MLLRSLGENETETGPGPGYDNPAVTCLYIFRNIDGRTLATQVLLRHCSEEDRFGAGEAAAVYLLNGLMAFGFLTIIAYPCHAARPREIAVAKPAPRSWAWGPGAFGCQNDGGRTKASSLRMMPIGAMPTGRSQKNCTAARLTSPKLQSAPPAHPIPPRPRPRLSLLSIASSAPALTLWILVMPAV